MKPDSSIAVDISDSNVNKNNLELRDTDKDTTEIYSREEKKDNYVEMYSTPTEVQNEENTVEIMASILSSENEDIFQKILSEKEKLPTVSMLDFAGQFAYYACHQIYVTPKAFFILVLDMTKRFEDIVSQAKEKQKGSIFSLWTYKEYLKFWITSIKTFGGTKAPVFVVATHTERKTTDEIKTYFEEFWEAVPEEDRDWLCESLNDREYAVGLNELNDKTKDILELMKKSIVELFEDENMKIELPSSWALMEQLLNDGSWKVLALGEIWKLNSSLPSEYQIESDEEMTKFLKCFHDNGLLLYFEEEKLREYAVLDIQWFANAFSKIIADENHINKDCKRRLITEWKTFNKTGELKDKLIDALWKDEPSYLKHKTEMMLYMEKLQMLVPLGSLGAVAESGMSWYVPCMNKKQFKADFCEEKWGCSSILCFRFTSFAMFVFYRLVAYCISCLRWCVAVDGDNEGNSCLYQTAAVFDHREHTVVIGICDKDIQLQVLRIRPLPVDKEVSNEIGDSTENAIKILTKTFHGIKTFKKGFKCQGIICNEKDLSFTLASELSKIEDEKMQCKCRLQEKHVINIQKTLGFWEKAVKSKVGKLSKKFRNPTESQDLKRRKSLPNTGPTHPFSKGTSQREVMTSEIKVEVSRSVGLIYIDEHPAGTGFCVGNSLIITCHHVIQSIFTAPPHFIDPNRIYIQFERKRHLQNVDPRKIFKFEASVKFTHLGFDFSVLELTRHAIPDVQFPPPLSSFCQTQLNSEVHLIGHPGGAQMMEDSEVFPRVIEPNNDVDRYIRELSQWSVQYFPDGLDHYSELRLPPRKILFHTTFNKGSSGSPGIMIKNHKPCVVLMVRGGAPGCVYENKFPGMRVEDCKRVEYGYAMEDIYKEMIFSSNQNIRQLSSEIFREWV